MINRSSIIVRPKPPYLHWASEVDEEGEAPAPDAAATVYLVPEYADDEEARAVITQCFDLIFQSELSAWHPEESAWPANRDLDLFREWFTVEFNAEVMDLCSYEIVDEG